MDNDLFTAVETLYNAFEEVLKMRRKIIENVVSGIK